MSSDNRDYRLVAAVLHGLEQSALPAVNAQEEDLVYRFLQNHLGCAVHPIAQKALLAFIARFVRYYGLRTVRWAMTEQRIHQLSTSLADASEALATGLFAESSPRSAQRKMAPLITISDEDIERFVDGIDPEVDAWLADLPFPK